VAFVCDRPDGVSGEVVQATVAELKSLEINCGRSPSLVTHQLSGKILGLAPDAEATVYAGALWGTVVAMSGSAAASYQTRVPADTYDLAAFAQTGGKTTRALLRRGVAVGADTVVDLDFAANGIALVGQPLTVTGAATGPGYELTTTITLHTARGSVVGWTEALPGSGPGSYAALSADDLGRDDRQELTVASAEPGAATFNIRGVVRGFRAPRAFDITLPPPFSSVQVGPAATAPTLRPRMTFEPYDGAVFYQMDAYDPGQTRPVGWLAIVSAAWLGGRTSYDLPDFAGARGFDDGFAFRSQAVLQVEPYAVRSTRDFARTITSDAATHDGSEVQYAKTLRTLSAR
jgi:hypothetical protein